MEQKEFADVVLNSDLLTLKEVKEMVKYFNSVLNSTVGFLESKRGSLLKDRSLGLNRWFSIMAGRILLNVMIGYFLL